MSNFAERLRQAMFDKRYKAIDVARGTNITPSVISRYLSGTNQPSRDNFFAVAKYLGVSSEWLLSSSETPESLENSKYISSDKDKVIAVQEELLKHLEKQIKNLEEAKTESKERHTKRRGQTKNPTKPNKRKVGFMKKHKPKK